MTSTSAPMPVADALSAGAPRTLGALAAAATGCGWGVMVERDATADAWTLVVATPSDSRTGRYTWRAGKWATAGRGYRETVAWYRSGMESLPGAAAETAVEEVKVPAGDVSAETRAEAEAGVAAARAALDAVKAGQKAEEALAEARKHADAAGGFQHSAETAQAAAEAARTWAEADAEADQAEADAEGAAESVVECKRAFQRAQRAANECRKFAEAATGALYETEADRAYDRAKDARETARETLGSAEEAAEAAKEAAEAARETADDECMKCGEWLCACREIMCAMLARYGSGAARTVDPEAVRIGELIMSDEEELRAAGQLMLCGEWAEAEEAIERAEEGPAEAEERRAAVRAAEAAVEPAAPVATCDGRTARQWAEEAEGHAYRAAEAYELTATAVRHRTNIYDAMPVERLDETEGARVRAAFARIDRRSRTAYNLELSARRDWYDGTEITDPARARDCAERARVLADGCEAEARTVAEAFAWAEAEAAAAAELQRAEWSLADAEERYEAARRPNAWVGAQGVDRRIGETNALRLVWIARQALAAVNGAPFIAYPTLTDRGTVKGWSVGYCTVSRYAGTSVRIVDTSADQDRAEMIAEAKNREHAARTLCERMAGELVIMRALMNDARHADTRVPGGRYRQARTALETAEELHDRAARERGTEAADRIAPVADRVRALSATVAEYARDREEWARNQRAAEAARAEAAPVPAPASAPIEEAAEEAPRYRFGRRDAEGRYPVSVDGVPVGHVYRTRRTWWALGLDETRRTDHTSRAEAAARLVGLVDVRAAAEADVARRMRARTVAPRGWRFTTWDAVESGDVVRTPGRCVPVRGGFGDGGPLSPERWGAPVTLTGVERLDNGCVVARGREGNAPGWGGTGVLLSTPAYAEIGLLVPDAEAEEAVPAAVEEAVEEAEEAVPAAAEAVPAAAEAVPAGARPAAGAPVGAPLSRLPRGGRVGGVRAGHTARQGATRQGTRQGTRQAPGRAGRSLPGRGERGPPPGVRPVGRVPALS